jgi:uncharacterized protein YyaL (SSP411 family)
LTLVLPGTTASLASTGELLALTSVPEEAGKVLQDLYDDEHGGFSLHTHLKFPHSDALELLLLLSNRETCSEDERQRLRAMVAYSLDQMCEGGLWDKDAGGFFRYSAASDWSAPHTEKMLEENVCLLRLLIETASITSEQRWYDFVQHLLFYINTHLWMPEKGIFAGSQSADEAYYEPGLYSHSPAEAPQVDTTVYTSWNAQAISAYLLAARVLHRPSLDTIALAALDWLCQHMLAPGGSVYHYARETQGELACQLTDQVWMTCALLDAYERHHNKAYLNTAIAIMHACQQALFDDHAGLFYDVPEDAHAVGRLAERMQPLTENALAAENLLRIASLTGQEETHALGRLVLERCLEQYRRTGIQGATYARVVLQYGV